MLPLEVSLLLPPSPLSLPYSPPSLYTRSLMPCGTALAGGIQKRDVNTEFIISVRDMFATVCYYKR